MRRRVVLHIGTMKSGTSYLQSLTARNAAELRAVGIEVGGHPAKANRRGRPHRAAEELLHPERGRRHWQRILTQIETAPGQVSLVSSEFLSFLDAGAARQALEDLRGNGAADVTVVITVRDQFRAVPAQWQTFTRNFGQVSFADYGRSIMASRQRVFGVRDRAYRTFHRAQDLGAIVERWNHPGLANLAFVAVPGAAAATRPPRTELWRRFCAAADLPVEASSSVSDALVPDNESIGYASCEYLRRLNRHLSDLPGREYRQLIRPLVRGSLAALRPEQDSPALDRRLAEFARARNAEFRALMPANGTFVGDLADLPVPESLAGYGSTIAPPAEGQVRDSARAAYRYAVEAAGVDPAESDDLDALISETAVLLRSRR